MKPLMLGPQQHYGHVHAYRSVAGLYCNESLYTSGMCAPWHCHELAYFTLNLEGAYHEDYRSVAHNYPPYSLVFHPSGEKHQGRMLSGDIGRFFNIEVDPSWLLGLADVGTLPQSQCDLSGGDLVWLAARVYRECNRWDACSELTIEGVVWEMLAMAARHAAPAHRRSPRWLSGVVERLHDEHPQRLTVAELAQDAGVHPVHLSRVFRASQRQSIGDYVRRLRILSACRMLGKKDSNLADIALTVGFSDQSQFTRAFKRVTGSAPAAFQHSLRRR